jgi:hypothetical protein
MGRELETTITFDGVTRRNATVHLDTRALQVSGRPRIEVRFAEIERVEVAGGGLRLSTPRGLLVIQAGEQAQAWAEKIRTPAPRAKKLGLKAGASVALSGLADPLLAAEVESAGAQLVALKAGVDLVFFGVQTADELARLPALAQRLAPAGALWVVRTKGRGASVSEQAVRAAARGAGLVDVKVVAFSDTQSADKFVIPLAERPRGSAPRNKPPKAAKPKAARPKRER